MDSTKMCSQKIDFTLGVLIFVTTTINTALSREARIFQCGPYGFICEGNNRLRLCDDTTLRGPAFICPANTVCNENSNDVCDSTYNYIPGTITRRLNCRRNERIADTTVPDCKGYILCILNKNRLQGIKFKCSGTTIFNGYTRTCSSPEKYKCPVANLTRTVSDTDLFGEQNLRMSNNGPFNQFSSLGSANPNDRAIHCKDYKFRVIEDTGPIRATYFCPTHSPTGGPVKCTIFSNQYCLTLERADEDQFLEKVGLAYRRPRNEN